MFNKSIVSGTFPSEWKHAKVIPVHKGKERDDMINYRPISLISAIAKIFERLIYDQLYDYLSNNNLLSNYQSRFRPLHSTVTALLDATTQWFVNMDEGEISTVIFLDLSKDFDTVDHLILLSKLSLRNRR